MSGEVNRDGAMGSASGTSRRSAGKIMLQLIGLIKPLLHIMLPAIALGTAGYLCAIFLTILAGQTILRGLADGARLNCWRSSGIRFLLRFANFARRSLRDVIREI